MPNTIKWFIEEFKDEEVGLIVKTNMAKNCHMDREVVFGQLNALANQIAPDRKCKLYLLHGDLTDEEMHSVYTHDKVSALVSLTHGEGFGLPLFEAAYTGLPVICTGWSGQLDFLVDEEGKNNYYNVGFDLSKVQPEVVWDGVLIADSMWSYAREASTKEKMRQCYEDIVSKNEESIAIQACNYANYTQDRFSQEKQYGLMVDTVMNFIGTSFEEQEEWRGILDQVVEYE
jgi:glycosyltransferase involved in cell wall biosynthesis